MAENTTTTRASDRRVTERTPTNRSHPEWQTAADAASGWRGPFGLESADRRLYELVERSIEYCRGSISHGLEVDSKVLTDTLYWNISQALAGEVVDDDFIQWVADTLAKQGAVVSDGGGEGGARQTVRNPTQEQDAIVRTYVDAVTNVVRAQRASVFSAIASASQT